MNKFIYKTIYFALLMCCTVINTHAQTENKTADEKVYVAVEQQAEFPGGQAALMRYLADNTSIPKDSDLNGRVLVKFVVDKTGKIKYPTILESVCPELDKEAIRVVEGMPNWKAGRNNGIPVNSYYILPIVFRHQNR